MGDAAFAEVGLEVAGKETCDDQNGGGPGAFREILCQLQAVHVGELQVQQDEIIISRQGGFFGGYRRLLRVDRGGIYFVARGFQTTGDDASDSELVVYKQDAVRQRGFPFTQFIGLLPLLKLGQVDNTFCPPGSPAPATPSRRPSLMTRMRAKAYVSDDITAPKPSEWPHAASPKEKAFQGELQNVNAVLHSGTQVGEENLI